MAQDSPRLFLEPEVAFVVGAAIVLEPGQARYLGTVLRQEAGAEVRLFNGRDGEWRGRLDSVRKDRGVVVLEACVREARATEGLVLYFAPLKRDATDLVVRMATELGAVRLVPVVTERTNTHRVNEERLRAIAVEAAEQCERLDVPEIGALTTLGEVLDGWAGGALHVALERRDGEAGGEVRARDGVLIGPEGGFGSLDLALLERVSFVRAVSLGPLVLRADTAACVALGVLSGRMREVGMQFGASSDTVE